MSSWAGTKYQSPEEAKAKCDGMFWYWQLQTRAYWLLEEVDGFNMDDWAYEHSKKDSSANIKYIFEKCGINLSRCCAENRFRNAIDMVKP